MNHATRRQSRMAFTIVEVVLVVALLALLLALLLPAIQRVREVANAVRCRANLKTLSAAIADMTQGNRPLPMGGASAPQAHKSWLYHFNPSAPELPARGVQQNWGWAFQILPHLGREQQWAAKDVFAMNEPPPALFSTQVSVPEFLCPSRGRQRLVERPVGAHPFAAIDYAGNGGHLSFVHPVTGVHESNRFKAYAFPYTSTALPHSGLIGAAVSHKYDGLRIDPPLRPSDIDDGLSATLLLGEKRMNLYLAGSGDVAAAQPGDQFGFCSGFGTDTVRTGAYPLARDDFSSTKIIPDGFGSSHPGACHFLFADGSVRALRYGLGGPVAPGQLTLLQRLCHRRDGQNIDLSALE